MVLGVICLGVWSLVALRSSLLDVDRVQVSGAAQTSASEVQAALGAGPGAPMHEVDPSGSVERLEALPWVSEARVSRLWPGTVRVVLVEREAIARAQHPDGWALIDGEGRVLAVAPTSPSDLPVLTGAAPGAPGAQLGADDRETLAALDGLPEAVAGEVVELARGRDGVTLAFESGPCVVLGDASDLAAKAVAAGAIRARVDGDGPARLDVRVPTAPALTRGGTCA